MTTSRKVLWTSVPAFVTIGVIAAVIFGAASTRREETTIPAGTTLVAALQRSVSTERSQPGDPVDLRLVDPVRLASNEELPPGAVIRGEVVEAKSGGRVHGAPTLALRFDRIEIDGESSPISAAAFRVTGKGDGQESVAEIGGGTVLGGAIAGLLGGGDDVAKGAVVGAAIGTGVAVATKGDDIALGAGQKIKVHLTDAATVKLKGNKK